MAATDLRTTNAVEHLYGTSTVRSSRSAPQWQVELILGHVEGPTWEDLNSGCGYRSAEVHLHSCCGFPAFGSDRDRNARDKPALVYGCSDVAYPLTLRPQEHSLWA